MFQSVSCALLLFLPPTCVLFNPSATCLATLRKEDVLTNTSQYSSAHLLDANSTHPSVKFLAIPSLLLAFSLASEEER